VGDGELCVEAARLEFMDHRAMRTLADHARRRGVTLVLHDARPILSRLAQLLGRDELRVAPAG
jgi:anti-anti-sigma regulatory factor